MKAGEYAAYFDASKRLLVTICVGSYGAPVLSNVEVAEIGKYWVNQVLVTERDTVHKKN